MTEKHKVGFFTKIKIFFETYKYLVQVIHGMLLTIAFHPFDIFIVIPVAFSGFIISLEKECFAVRKEQLFKVGFKHGFAFFFGHFITSLYWVIIPLFVDVKQYFFLIPLGLLGLPALLASFYAIVSGVISKYLLNNIQHKNLRRKRVVISLAFSFGFFIAEILRSHLIIPFPWNLLGYATSYSLSLMQFASVVGVYGLSLLMYLIGAIPYTRNALVISLMTLIVFLVTISGRSRLNNMDANVNQTISAALYIVQPNINSTKMTHESYKVEIEKIKALIGSIETSKANDLLQLIILPETGIPGSITTQTEFIFKDEMAQHSKNTMLISGVDRYNNISNKHFNSMIVVNQHGEIMDSYDKIILAPFGEYIPGLDFIKAIVSKNYGFTPGSKIRNFRLYNSASDEALVIMPTICFESIFSPIVDHRNMADLDFILNITNDSWLGDSLGPYQHLAMARMRAIEYGVPVVRVTKTGVSAVFNSHGRLMRSLPFNTEGIMIVNMSEDKVVTPYMKILKFFKGK